MDREDLANALKIPADLDDEETSQAIVGLIKQATGESSPQTSLSEIYHVISQHGAASLLDPLDTISLLLPERDQAAKDILALVGECGNAKEVVIATQEAIERIESILDSEDDDLEASGTQSSQLIMLIDLYSSSIPRLKIHKKTPSETLRPLLSQLESVADLIGRHATRADGQDLISHVSHLVQNVAVWVKASANDEIDDFKKCADILRRLLDRSLAVCANSINSSLAQRTFENLFPRLVVRSVVNPGWEEGAEVISNAIDAFISVGITNTDALVQPSIGSLIYLAHTREPLPSSQMVLSGILGSVLASIQTNMALDESLSILLKTLTDANKCPKQELAADIIIPLFTVLPTLASTHSDPNIRMQVFRIISLLLSLAPSPLRLQILRDLTSDPDLPQMCVAAIELLKEAVLEALSLNVPNVFASYAFLQTFGPVLFCPRPSNFLSLRLSMDDLRDSQELPRLVQCLSLYYVLLLRDKQNKTGIRDRITISSVEQSLLAPLRSSLREWIADANVMDGHFQAGILLASLQISLERVDGVLREGFRT